MSIYHPLYLRDENGEYRRTRKDFRYNPRTYTPEAYSTTHGQSLSQSGSQGERERIIKPVRLSAEQIFSRLCCFDLLVCVCVSVCICVRLFLRFVADLDKKRLCVCVCVFRRILC